MVGRDRVVVPVAHDIFQGGLGKGGVAMETSRPVLVPDIAR